MPETKEMKPRPPSGAVPEKEVVAADTTTTCDLAKMLGVIPLTIFNWRTEKGLPYIRVPGEKQDTILFDIAAVRKWAAKHGIPFNRI